MPVTDQTIIFLDKASTLEIHLLLKLLFHEPSASAGTFFLKKLN